MNVGCAPQMSHHLARDSVEHEEQCLYRSKVLQSVESFNTRMRKSTFPQLSQYEASIAARMGVVTKQMVLMTALLLHLLALLLATIVNVVVNVSVVRRQTVGVLAVAAFDILVAAAVAADFLAVDMFALVLCHVFPPVIPL